MDAIVGIMDAVVAVIVGIMDAAAAVIAGIMDAAAAVIAGIIAVAAAMITGARPSVMAFAKALGRASVTVPASVGADLLL